MDEIAAFECTSELALDGAGIAVEEQLERGIPVGVSHGEGLLPPCGGISPVRFKRLQLLETPGMTPAFELAGQEGVDDFTGNSLADAPGAEAENVRVRVLSGATRGEGVVTEGGPYAPYLVRADSHAHAVAANENAEVLFAAGDSL